MKKVSTQQALSRLQKICSIQEKCSSDLIRKLKSWDLSEEEILKIIDSLKKDKFLDDNRFAIYFVREKFKINKWGRGKINFALKKKEIDAEIRESALREINEENSIEILKDLLIRKKKGIKSSGLYELKGKLIRFGTQRGFSFEIVYKVVEEILKV